MSDSGLLAMINSVLLGKSPASPHEPEASEEQPPAAETSIAEPGPAPAPSEFEPNADPTAIDQPVPATGRRRLTVEQMEGVIRKALAELPEFGNGEGTQIIVYGHYPWNALALFEANSVSSENARAIKQAVELAVETLRRDYDIVMPTS